MITIGGIILHSDNVIICSSFIGTRLLLDIMGYRRGGAARRMTRVKEVQNGVLEDADMVSDSSLDSQSLEVVV